MNDPQPEGRRGGYMAARGAGAAAGVAGGWLSQQRNAERIASSSPCSVARLRGRSRRAQQPAMPVVGFVRMTTPDDSAPFLAAFRRGLSEAGYVEGQNVAIEDRYAFNQVDRLPALMAELESRRVAILAATGGIISARRQSGDLDDSDCLHDRG
jgi:hypothetical protein